MRKAVVFIALVLIVAMTGFAQTEDIDVYVFLYRAAMTNSAQLDILQSMAQARLTGAGEFYAQALRRLVSEYGNIRSVTERNAADEQAMILSALLGAEGYTPAAPDLWLVVEGFQAPLVKAEALMSLGRIRARNYLPQVIRVLNGVNAAPTADRLSGERIAFGAIISLEKYQDPTGYLPVFFASTGWYSNRIRDQARRSLPFIAEDPSPFMIEVIQGPSYNVPMKLTALQSIESSQASNDVKARAAVAALSEGWRITSSERQIQVALVNMRKRSIRMLSRFRSNDGSMYSLLERSYTNGADNEERLLAISALAAQRTDESARVLSSFLANLNNRRRTGVTTRDDEQMVRAIIPALGQTGRPIGRPALNEVGGSNWTPAVIELASTAIRQIGN